MYTVWYRYIFMHIYNVYTVCCQKCSHVSWLLTICIMLIYIHMEYRYIPLHTRTRICICTRTRTH